MKQTAILCYFFLSTIISNSQVFTGTAGTILNNGQDTYFNITVSGISAPLDSVLGLEEVCFDISHPSVDELYIYLKSPSGNVVQLTAGSSNLGANYTNTCFNSNETSSITTAIAPYTGSYRPIGYLGRFNNGQSGNGTWTLIVHDYLAHVDSGTVNSWSIKFGNLPSSPLNLISSNLPIVVINSNNQAISNSKITVNMGIIDNGTNRNHPSDPMNNFSGPTEIHIRGSSSKNFEKKSFSLETHDSSGNSIKVPLLGMPGESDWVLSASYVDKTLLRNSLTYDIFGKMGHYSPRTKYVEVIVNNEYRGVYSFLEKLKRDNNRIDISKLTATDNSYPDVTGGYIIQIDRRNAPGWNSLMSGDSQTNSHFFYQYVYPKDSDITIPQRDYIKSALDSFETAIASPTFADPLFGYQKYIDVKSFIDFFIINELSKNVDAYRLSTYLYKDKSTKGGKIHIGPVWDYDIAWHNCNYSNSYNPIGWEYQLPADPEYPNPTWWKRLFQDNNFVNALYCRWQELHQNMLSATYLNSFIDSTALFLNEAQQRNFTQWPTIGANIFPNPQNQLNATYAGEINDLKNWISSRISWMDANIAGICNVGVNAQENNFAENLLQSFPNPFTSDFTIVYKIPLNASVKMELLNTLGEQVLLLINEDRMQGTYNEKVDTRHLTAGVYIIKLSVNNHIYHQKIVKVEAR